MSENRFSINLGLQITDILRQTAALEKATSAEHEIKIDINRAEENLRRIRREIAATSSSYDRLLSHTMGHDGRETISTMSGRRKTTLSTNARGDVSGRWDVSDTPRASTAYYDEIYKKTVQLMAIQSKWAGQESKMPEAAKRRVELLEQEIKLAGDRLNQLGSLAFNEDKHTKVLDAAAQKSYEIEEKRELARRRDREQAEKDAERIAQANAREAAAQAKESASEIKRTQLSEINALYRQQADLVKKIGQNERAMLTAGPNEQAVLTSQNNQYRNMFASNQEKINASGYADPAKTLAIQKQIASEVDKTARAQGKLNDQQSIGTAALDTMYKTLVSIATIYALKIMRDTWREAVNYATEYTDALNEIRIVTGYTQAQADALGKRYREIAQNLSVGSLDVATMGASLYRQGLGSDKAVEGRMESVIKYSKIAGEEVKASADIIAVATNTFQRYGESADDAAMRVVDVWTYMGDAVETEAGEIGRAMQKVVANAKVVGLSLEKTSSFIATISSVTREAPEVVGTALNRIISRYEKLTATGMDRIFQSEEGDAVAVNDVAKALDTIGITLYETGRGFMTFGDVIDEVGGRWETMTEAQQRYIATQMAGVQGINKFYALMQGYGDSLELYEGAMNAAGSANQKYAIYTESVTAAHDDLKNSLEGLYDVFLNGNALISWYKGMANIVDILKTGMSALGGFNTQAIAFAAALGGVAVMITKVAMAIKAAITAEGKLSLFSLLGGGKVKVIIAAIAALAVTVYSIAGYFSNAANKTKQFTEELERLSQEEDRLKGKQGKIKGYLKELEDLKKESLSTEEASKKYLSIMEKIRDESPDVANGILKQNGAFKDLKGSVEGLNGELANTIASLNVLKYEKGLASFSKIASSLDDIRPSAEEKKLAKVDPEFLKLTKDDFVRYSGIKEKYNAGEFNSSDFTFSKAHGKEVPVSSYLQYMEEQWNNISGEVLGTGILFGNYQQTLINNFIEKYKDKLPISKALLSQAEQELITAKRDMYQSIMDMIESSDDANEYKALSLKDKSIVQNMLRDLVGSAIDSGASGDNILGMKDYFLKAGTGLTETLTKEAAAARDALLDSLPGGARSSGQKAMDYLTMMGLRPEDNMFSGIFASMMDQALSGDELNRMSSEFEVLKKAYAGMLGMDGEDLEKFNLLEGTEENLEGLRLGIESMANGVITPAMLLEKTLGSVTSGFLAAVQGGIDFARGLISPTDQIEATSEAMTTLAAQAAEAFKAFHEEAYKNNGAMTDAGNLQGLLGEASSIWSSDGKDSDAFREKYAEIEEYLNGMSEAAKTTLFELIPSLGVLWEMMGTSAIASLDGASKAMAQTGEELTDLQDEIDEVTLEKLYKEAERLEKKGKFADGFVEAMKDIHKGGKPAFDATKKLTDGVKKLSGAQQAASFIQQNLGKTTSETTLAYEELAEYTGYSVEELKNNLAPALQGLDYDVANTASYMDYLVNSMGAAAGINFSTGNWQSQLAALANSADPATRALAAVVQEALKVAGTKITANVSGDGKTVSFGMTNTGSGYSGKARGVKPSGGGGGGGGRGKEALTETALFLEGIEKSSAVSDLERDILQLNQTLFENRGQLTMLNKVRKDEYDQLKKQAEVDKQNLAAIEARIRAGGASKEDLEKLQKAHEEYSKKIVQNTIDLEELERVMKETTDAIREKEIDLRDTIHQAILDREELESSMLDSRISLEDQILEAIQERHQKEWDLIKEDIDKKKEALNEELKLLNDNLNERKRISEDEDKRKELSDLESQLAIISSDPTRTKDQLELRKKISALREDLAWKTAEEEVKAQGKSIQQQIDSLDEYGKSVDEAYENMFENPQAFLDEMRELMTKTDDEIIAWLQANNAEYASASDARKAQMDKEWEDTLLAMKGQVKTHWDEVETIIAQGDQAIIDFLKANSADYKEAGKLQAEAYVDEWKKKIKELKDAYVELEELINPLSPSGAPAPAPAPAAKRYRVKYSIKDSRDNSTVGSGSGVGGTKSEARSVAESYAKKKLTNDYYRAYYEEAKAYKKGGLVDYTGMAMVHGSQSNPEAFLSAVDTKNIRILLNMFDKVLVPSIRTPSVSTGKSGGSLVIENLTIQVEKLDTDQDLELLAERVIKVIGDDVGIVSGAPVRWGRN